MFGLLLLDFIFSVFVFIFLFRYVSHHKSDEWRDVPLSQRIDLDYILFWVFTLITVCLGFLSLRY